MSKDELKACPFCPSTDTVVQVVGLSNGFVQYAGSCNYCGARGQAISSELSIAHAKKYAAQAWNTRRAQWVAVSERLPEVLQDVLLITKYKRVIMGYRDQNASGIFITFSANYPINDITHWLPLNWLPLPETADK